MVTWNEAFADLLRTARVESVELSDGWTVQVSNAHPFDDGCEVVFIEPFTDINIHRVVKESDVLKNRLLLTEEFHCGPGWLILNTKPSPAQIAAGR